MKRKIAAFANGWSDEYLMIALKGIQKCAQDHDIDVYLFVDYSSQDNEDENVQGEINILNLPKLTDYDGVLLMGNTLNNAGELDILKNRLSKVKVPAVCLEYDLEGVDSICTENYSGMRELCDHLFDEHDYKRVVWVAGLKGNKENDERFRALSDSLAAHGLSLADEDIVHGDFSYYAVQINLAEWLKTHTVPDVFVCANDVMAMGVVSCLSRENIEVPKDVKVTGFDNIQSAMTFIPAMTTVDRKWNQRSYDGLKHLIDLIDGGEKTGTVSYPSSAVIRESCGCNMAAEMKPDQKESLNHLYAVPIERTLFDWHLTGLDEATSGRFTLEDIHDGLQGFFSNSITSYEGDTFCICLDERFVQSMFDSVEPGCLGYSEQVHVLYAKRDGKHLPYQKIKTSYIFPVFSSPEEKGNIYCIAPLHSLSSNIGYVVFKNQTQILETFFLYSWLRHLRTGLMRCRQNIIMDSMNKRLNELSLMDELSGLLNRKGYEHKGIPMLEQLKAEKKRALMMVVDINKMKMINDRYGHLQGDLAIRLVSKAIRETIPENWYGIRYGGDEFVIIGENVFVDDGAILEKKLCAAVEHEAVALMIPFKLSISVGSVLIDPSENISLDEYFRRADDAMYKMKKNNDAERKE